MSGFGEKLRRERESHDATLEDIARSTRIDPTYLDALEREEFDKLPGRAFGKFYIRAYAEVLGFDPGALIADYDAVGVEPDAPVAVAEAAAPAPSHPWREALQRERDEARRVRESAAAPAQAAPEPPADAAPPAASVPVPDAEGAAEEPAPATPHETAPGPTVSALGLAVLVVGAAIWVATARLRAPETEAAPQAGPVASQQRPPAPQAAAEARETAPSAGSPAVQPAPAARKPAAAAASGPALTVDRFGVGRRMVGLELQGQDDRFAEGSVVWFATRVLGGRRGQVVRHVWLREGKLVEAIELELGGGHWRTNSRKTLWGVGDWAVEARDARGAVLARAEFSCVPAR